MRDIEHSVGFHGLELRLAGASRPRLIGWAARFDQPSRDLGGFVEVIRPGAFSRSLATADRDVLALVEHTPKAILGRRSVQTLFIEEDDRGLHVEILPPDTQDGRDVIENVRLGNLDGMSFAFRVPEDGANWVRGTNPPLRELLNVDLHEVSVVAMPAYPSTEVALRSLWQALASTPGHPNRPLTVSDRLAWSHRLTGLDRRR